MALRLLSGFYRFSTILKLAEKFIHSQKEHVGREFLVPGYMQVHDELLYPSAVIHKFFITFVKRPVENPFVRARGIKRIIIFFFFLSICVTRVSLFRWLCHLSCR